MEELCTNCHKPLPEIEGGVWRSPYPRPTKCSWDCIMLACWSCGEKLTEENASPSVLEQRSGRCRKCDTVYQSELDARLKLEVFSHYCAGEDGIPSNPSCQCPGCKSNQIFFLTMDHVNGDGAAHLTPNGKARLLGRSLWYWLRREGYPAGFQVLCFNCNCAKRQNKVCPAAGTDH